MLLALRQQFAQKIKCLVLVVAEIVAAHRYNLIQPVQSVAQRRTPLDRFHFTAKMESMKTTLNIPDERMAALLEATEAKTRTEAVNKAIEDYIHRENVKKVLALEGSIDDFMTHRELSEMREAD